MINRDNNTREPSDSHSHESLLAVPIGKLTQTLIAAPRLVLWVAVGFATLSVVIAATQMGFRGNRLALLNPDNEFNQRWIAYLHEFGREDDIVLVVESDRKDRIFRAIDSLEQRVRAEPFVENVFVRRDLRALRTKALHYVPIEELERILAFTEQFQPIVEGGWAGLSPLATFQQAADAATHSDRAIRSEVGSESIENYLEQLRLSLHDGAHLGSPWEQQFESLRELSARFDSQYLLSEDEELGFLVLQIVSNDAESATSSRDIARLREIAKEVADRFSVGIGITGMPILESDEMAASQSDSTWTGIFSFAGVSLIFMAGFGGIRRPAMALFVLLLALAWTFGYLTILVGHLNVLSAAFGVILIGLGIDFSIHYLAQFEHQLRPTVDVSDAIVSAASKIGPGIVTGGVTTALAFFAASLTDFTGIVELGIIAGGGVLLCVCAATLVLPALLVLFDTSRNRPARARLKTKQILLPAQRHPQRILAIAAMGTAILSIGLRDLRYDHNLLNLQPEGLQSVALEQRLSESTHRSAWFAVSVARSLDEVRRRKEIFEGLTAVTATEEVATLLPPSSQAKSDLIEKIGRNVQGADVQVPLLAVPPRDQFLRALGRLRILLPDRVPFDESSMQGISQLTPLEYFDRVSRFQQRGAEEVRRAVALIHEMANSTPPDMNDLPAPLRERFHGRTGKHVIRIYGMPDLWDMENLEQFVHQLEDVDPDVTGHPIQTFYASHQMRSSFLEAAVYALLAVSAVLMIDFRRVRLWLLAMLPVSLGMLQMLGLLGWLGIPLNAANLIVLPLILGIGIDDGVHVVHDFVAQGRKRYRVSNATATAVLLTSATTMIGFGSMMFATHRGLRSLGQVLTIGIFCCLFSSLLVLPPLLSWFESRFSGRE